MKRLLALCACTCFVLVGKAQQIPLYSNYFFTPYVYNPATSGSQGVTTLTLLHRRQWSDVQGAPETSALGLNGSLNEQKVGWSVYGFSDVTDIIQRWGFYGNYAYRVRLADNATLAFGLGAGYLRNDIDMSGVRLKDGLEPIGSLTNSNRGDFDLNTGINLEIADFTLGFAVPQLLGGSIEYTTDLNTPVNFSLIRHYIANAQYNFKFAGDKMVLTPNVMMRVAENVPFQVDAGLIFNLTEYGYVGAMFRSDYAVTANIGLNLTEEITFGYAYDFSTNEFGPSLGTSHEFMLMYRFGSDKRNDRLENEIKRLKADQRKMRDETEEIVDEKLEEFKDQYRREIQKEIEEAASKVVIPAQTTPANTGANPQGGATGGNPQGGGASRPGTTQPGGTTQPAGGTQPGRQPATGATGSTGYNPANSAENVAPGSKGYYVVAGVFSNQQNAEKQVRRLSEQGIQARYFQDMNNFYFYVYLLKFDTYQEADQAKASNINGRYTGDLWIKILE